MDRFKTRPARPATVESELPLFQRTPQRLSATVSWELHQRLIARSYEQGRSLSNLVAHLLETGCPE